MALDHRTTRGRDVEERIAAMQQEIAGLQRRSADLPEEAARLVVQAMEDLRIGLEELLVVEEELRQQSDELAESRGNLDAERRRYQDLFEFAPGAYLVTDAQGSIREANQAAEDLLKVPAGHLAGRRLAFFVPSERRPAFDEQLERLAGGRGERLNDWESELWTGPGSRFPAALTAAPVIDRAGHISGLRWLLRDVSERKRTERRLAELAEDARRQANELDAVDATIASLVDGLIVCAPSGAVLRLNRAAESILGLAGGAVEQSIDRLLAAQGIEMPEGAPYPPIRPGDPRWPAP